MNVPEVIPISHRPDYRTDTIGRWQGGQFLASALGLGAGRYYAVLHRFDGAGRHLDSRIHPAGEAPQARLLLAEWLDALPGREYGDIAIAPFAVHVDGELFGLVREDYEPDEVDDEEERVHFELYPDGLGFDAPWCGCYDT
ncbi:hypothetical protein DR950_14855 [Kitasatospora xanthocidica]|uniref:Uncharacterized protein n=1 Tax=Kitasatospora xanthocidica TaxID=83382 RepID=A0A372ZUC2_9ACTN|nr:hypothetical protein [Kitasatospora xanthocidica]RGD58887.1 hypothetical protein DR950_14855 [Kitasatospora xanthocidica]